MDEGERLQHSGCVHQACCAARSTPALTSVLFRLSTVWDTSSGVRRRGKTRRRPRNEDQYLSAVAFFAKFALVGTRTPDPVERARAGARSRPARRAFAPACSGQSDQCHRPRPGPHWSVLDYALAAAGAARRRIRIFPASCVVAIARALLAARSGLRYRAGPDTGGARSEQSARAFPSAPCDAGQHKFLHA